MESRLSSRGILGAALAALVALQPAFAQTWIGIGPTGGRITALASSAGAPTLVLAGPHSGGLYRSLDAGSSWAPTGAAQLGTETVHVAAIDPSDPDIAWVGTESKGIFRSGDGGATWAPANIGLPLQGTRYGPVWAIAADPANPSLVLAGLGWGGPVGKPFIFRSTDGGQSWAETAGTGLEGGIINDLAFGAGAAFAATDGRGAWVSEDGGQFWEHVGDDTIDNTSVEALVVDETTSPPRLLIALGDSVYSATPPASPAPVTAKRASKWAVAAFLYFASYGFKYNRAILGALEKGEFPPKPKPTPAPVPSALTAAATSPHPVSPAGAAAETIPAIFTGTLTNGVQRSLDGGDTWASYNTGLDPVEVDRLASSPGGLFAGAAGSGGWRRADGAAAWTRASTGLLAPTVSAIAVDPSAPATLYAGTEGGGVFKSVDGGATWGSVGFKTMVVNFFDPFVADVVIDAEAPATVLALVDRSVFRSENGGATWTRHDLPSGMFGFDLHAVSTGSGTVFWAAGAGGVARSADGGKTWVKPDPSFNQHSQRVAASQGAPQTIYVGTTSNGIHKSTNDGTSWGPVNNDGGSGFLTFGHVSALAIDPWAPDTVYAGVDRHALWKTTNGGTTWTNLTDGLFDQASFTYATLASIAVHPTNPQTLFAAVSNSAFAETALFSGVYRSNDGGAHWAKFGGGLAGIPTNVVIFDPNSSNRLYAGSVGHGAYRYGAAPVRAHSVRDRLSRP